MSLLLDSDVCIAYLNAQEPSVRTRLLGLAPASVNLCSVVKAELLYGARHSARVPENLARLAEFFAPFASLPFDHAAAEHYGLLRAQLRREGTPIGANDMCIAAIALANDLTLVTRNRAEYRRVAGLRVESW